jgi:peptide/nickel transport system permease protein
MMRFAPVLLWTDALVFVLIGCIVAAGLYVRRHEHLRRSWRRVAESRTAMAALAVLAVFVAVGLLDSVHYRPRLASADRGDAPIYSVEVWSALDALAAKLKTQVEKTYSAPFATHLSAKETMESAHGAQTRDFPRLKFGGAHLADPGRRLGDITGRALSWASLVAACWLLLSAAAIGSIARRSGIGAGQALRRIQRGENRIAWDAAWLTLGVLALLAVPAVALSSSYHVLGTDKVGNDVFYLTLKSIRTALVIGTLTTLAMLPLAALLGILAGYLGGWVDDVIQYVYTTLNSIPYVLLVAAAALMMQVVIDSHPRWFATAAERADARLLALCLILGVTSWTGLCRLLRAETFKLRELDYVEAACAFGVSRPRIMARHILPNLMYIVLIVLITDFSGFVLSEAVLSYVGIGVDPGTISFGTMINAARMELAREPVVWWSLAAAFVFMFTLVLTANILSDAVRDAFDPRLISRADRLPAAKAGA